MYPRISFKFGHASVRPDRRRSTILFIQKLTKISLKFDTDMHSSETMLQRIINCHGGNSPIQAYRFSVTWCGCSSKSHSILLWFISVVKEAYDHQRKMGKQHVKTTTKRSTLTDFNQLLMRLHCKENTEGGLDDGLEMKNTDTYNERFVETWKRDRRGRQR